MCVNGKELTLEKELPLSEFLDREGYVRQRVAVEKNGNIVPKNAFDSETLSNSDKLEIVAFVGGG